MDNLQDILISISDTAKQAINFDNNGNFEAAIYFYKQAVLFINKAETLGYTNEDILLKGLQYNNRADELTTKGLQKNEIKEQETGKVELGRANFMLKEALDLDEAEELSDAISMYSSAVELCILVSKERSLSPDVREKLKSLAERALSRAEVLKDQIKTESSVSYESLNEDSDGVKKVLTGKGIQTVNFGHLVSSKASSENPIENTTRMVKGLQLAGRASYTKEELDVLRKTSYINKREYVPFMSVDLREKFAFVLPFTDKDGLLRLAPKQKKHFSRWCRPEELSSEPKMIEVIDCYSIKQTCVSDCSFVASLAISSLYEKKFKKRLITDIIYPKNRHGEPVYNPCGKYMIKLYVNGIPRKVIIDDYLPVGKYNELLCSYSTNRNEFWISLIEKAYMKVMGGYDFPGSNSNIDLYALTGWIPERISLQDKDVNTDATYKKILERFHRGDVLVTVATGQISDAEADRAGLVSTHAYAMLDIREAKGKRMMLLKNPWSHLRWKGNFSELDVKNWTPEMCRLLNYDPKNAQMFDNGVFWIDFESLCHFFDVIYMNWNPKLFSHTFCLHQAWSAGLGPARDLYNIGENPQYSLEIQPTGGAGVCWVLLTRHIIDIEDFSDNKEYITLLVYKSGRKVFYPFDPPPYIDGVRINSPHYLCKMVLKGTEKQKFTLVVSQYEKQHTIFYSLRVYTLCPFTLNKIANYCKYKHEERGHWKGRSAGGCPNYPATYSNNPIYQFRIENNQNGFRVELKAPKEVQIGFEIVCVDAKNSNSSDFFAKKRSGSYRSGFSVIELDRIDAGLYNLIPSTFYPDQEAPYYLTLFSSSPIKTTLIKQ